MHGIAWMDGCVAVHRWMHSSVLTLRQWTTRALARALRRAKPRKAFAHSHLTSGVLLMTAAPQVALQSGGATYRPVAGTTVQIRVSRLRLASACLTRSHCTTSSRFRTTVVDWSKAPLMPRCCCHTRSYSYTSHFQTCAM